MTADSIDYVRICESCPPSDGWGPPVTTDTTLDGVPYAPFSKGDKLGRMADWTTEGKDRERGSRMQFQRNYRGELSRELWKRGTSWLICCRPANLWLEPRRYLQRPRGRGRVLLLHRQQRARQHKVQVRPWCRLHTGSWSRTRRTRGRPRRSATTPGPRRASSRRWLRPWRPRRWWSRWTSLWLERLRQASAHTRS